MSKSKPTVGYRYYMGLHMGICRGPVDELMEIRVGDRRAWRGRERAETWTLAGTGWAQARQVGTRMVADDSYAVTGSQTVTINAANLFGGAPSGEGGVQGVLTVMMGEPTQTAPAGLAAMLGGIVPGFRGFLSLYFDGMVGAMNPYPKTWTPRVRRTTAGWDGPVWYPAKATIWLGTGQGHDGIRAMNPAHLIYELYTNKDFGRGLPPARLDLASFQTAADQLYAEGFGLCLPWARQTPVAEFLQIVIDHIGAACAPDLSTGLIRLKLIRGDYVADDLPTFGYDSGLLAIDEEETPSTDAVANEIMVKWFDPVRKLERQTPPVQNLGSIQAVGRKTTTQNYPGLPTADLAMRVSLRDLKASTRALRRFRVRLDRRGYAVQPGDAFRLNVPVRGLDNLVVRAGRIEEGAITDGTITITCVQDVFGLPAAPQVAEQAPQPGPSYDVAPAITASRLLEVPYMVLAQSLTPAELSALAATSGFVGAVAAAPASYATDYLLYSRPGAAAYTYREDTGDWAATALAGAPVVATGAPVTVPLSAGNRLDTVAVGSPVLWEDEILRVDAIDTTALTATLARGCADTTPAPHASGSQIYFMGADMARDSMEYLVGEVVSVKLLARTPENFADPATVTAGTVTMAQRQYRPYPPGAMKINGTAYPTSITGGTVAVTWAHRDRLLEADQLVDTAEGSLGPEAGTTYNVRIYNGATLLNSVTGLTGTSYTYSAADLSVALLHFNGAHGSVVFTDEKGRTWSAGGAAQISTAQSVFGGASLRLDGASHISTASSADFAYGVGDFSWECRVRFDNVSGNQYIVDHGANGGTLILAGGRLTYYNATIGIGSALYTGGPLLSAGTWYTLAIDRFGGTTTMRVDGVAAVSAADAHNYVAQAVRIGEYGGGGFNMTGHVDEFRLTKAMGRNPADYTPSAAEFSTAGGALPSPLRVELEAVRSGLTSSQKHNHAFTVTP